MCWPPASTEPSVVISVCGVFSTDLASAFSANWDFASVLAAGVSSARANRGAATRAAENKVAARSLEERMGVSPRGESRLPVHIKIGFDTSLRSFLRLVEWLLVGDSGPVFGLQLL